ncbi:MAG: O-antigen ligase family protein [Bacteroidetes bacterium]|nr:O-antigen ligase family protein [Bacteroidota bacterium]
MRFIQLLYVALFFCLPLSVENLSLGFGINIPTEPIELLIAICLMFQYKAIILMLQSVYKNPLFISIVGLSVFSWLSCFSSQMAIVSIKYTLIETLHLLVFVGGIFLVEKENPKFFFKCMLAYSLTFVALLFHAWYLQAQYNFVIDFSAAAMRPFYKDHPLYGSAIAFLLPFWGYLSFAKTKFPSSAALKKVAPFVLLILLIGLFLSFSRAAWFTFVFALIFSLLLYNFRNKIQQLILVLTFFSIVILLCVSLFFKIAQTAEAVKSSSVKNQFLSAFNWTYDIANLERLNRYKCALRMFKEKPLTGFGNNMYKFSYFNYQQPEEMTRISLSHPIANERLGTGGNSHSDYLATLTELGIGGFASWFGIVFFALWFSLCKFFREQQTIFLVIFFALLTYVLHVAVNNFMHEEKISALFWMCCGVILASGYHSNVTKLTNAG